MSETVYTDKLLTINQTAEFLQITRQHVYNLINKKNLPVFHLGKKSPRIKYSELIEWINNLQGGEQIK